MRSKPAGAAVTAEESSLRGEGNTVSPNGWLGRLRREGVVRRIQETFAAARRQPGARGSTLFEQGGDSLDAVACALALEKDYRVDLPLEAFLTHTPAMLADVILRGSRPPLRRLVRDVWRGLRAAAREGRA